MKGITTFISIRSKKNNNNNDKLGDTLNFAQKQEIIQTSDLFVSKLKI